MSDLLLRFMPNAPGEEASRVAISCPMASRSRPPLD
jgi:hypothetical protein